MEVSLNWMLYLNFLSSDDKIYEIFAIFVNAGLIRDIN